jgi:hypothetical protein
VADLPLDALLARSDEAARRWAIALIATRPLDALGEIPLQTLAAGAPALCEQLTRALASDTALDALLAGGEQGAQELPARLAALAGSARPAALAEAVEALRGVIWELLLEQLPRSSADPGAVRLVGDAADRLAQTCAALLAAGLEQAGRVAVTPREDAAAALPRTFHPPAAQEPPRRREQPPLHTPGYEAPPHMPGDEAARPEDAPTAAEQPGIVIVDERRAAYASIERPPFRERVAGDGPGVPRERRSAWAPRGAEPAPGEAPAGGAEIATGGEISIRDERGGEGPAAWVGSIGRQLQRHERDGGQFAVLLLEVRAAGTAGAGAAELPHETLQDALAAELHESGGSLTRERSGRYWMLVPYADRPAAQALAKRLVEVVEAVARRSGTAAMVAVGTAICPDDGVQSAALAAHADVGLYASRRSAGDSA